MTHHSSNSPSSWADIDERTADRHLLRIATKLFNHKAGALDVVITDLNNFGCRVTLSERIIIGSSVTMALTSSIEVIGWVAWSVDGAIGVQFAHAMPTALCEAIVAQAAGY